MSLKKSENLPEIFLVHPTPSCKIFLSRIDIDECARDTCKNGATCTNSDSSYSCGCSGTGYGGTDCDVGKTNIQCVFMMYIFE